MNTQMKYARLDLGTIEAFANKIGGMEGIQKFLQGKLVVTKPACRFETWKTIRLGEYQVGIFMREALIKKGYKINDWANDLLYQTPFSPVVQEVDLVLVDIWSDLGFQVPKHGCGPSLSKICERAIEEGLEICPPEVGPRLRYDYEDQPYDEWLRVAMPALKSGHWDYGLFRIDHGEVGIEENGLWLRASNGEPSRTWGNKPDFATKWIFVKPRK